MTSGTYDAIISVLLIIGPAVVTFAVTMLLLRLAEYVSSKRRAAVDFEWEMELKRVRETFDAVPPDKPRIRPTAKPAVAKPRVEPLVVKARFQRAEWTEDAVDTLNPRADWN